MTTIHFDDDGLVSDDEDESEEEDLLDFDPSQGKLVAPPPSQSTLADDIERLRKNGREVRADALSQQPKKVRVRRLFCVMNDAGAGHGHQRQERHPRCGRQGQQARCGHDRSLRSPGTSPSLAFVLASCARG